MAQPLKKQLKEAREKRNLTIQQVAALTNIKTEHIRALEEGNYSFFSAPIYIRGFARSIAIALKMDVSEIMNQLDIELSEQRHSLKNADLHKSTETISATAETRTVTGIPWKSIGMAFFAIILCILGFFIVRHFIDLGPELPDQKSKPGTPGIIERKYDESLEIPSTGTVPQPSTLLD